MGNTVPDDLPKEIDYIQSEGHNGAFVPDGHGRRLSHRERAIAR